MLPLAAKELLKEIGAGAGEHASGDLHFMVEAGMVQNLEHGASGAGFGVGRAVYQPGNAGMDEGSSAHGARLNSGIHNAAGQAMIS